MSSDSKTSARPHPLWVYLISALTVTCIVVLFVLVFTNPSAKPEEDSFWWKLAGMVIVGTLSLAGVICTTIILVCKFRVEQKNYSAQINEEFRKFLSEKPEDGEK